VRHPDRVARPLLVLTLATLWMCALGRRVIRSGLLRLVDDASRRRYLHRPLTLLFFPSDPPHGKCHALSRYPQVAGVLALVQEFRTVLREEDGLGS